jgi:hypothetical protein
VVEVAEAKEVEAELPVGKEMPISRIVVAVPNTTGF